MQIFALCLITSIAIGIAYTGIINLKDINNKKTYNKNN